MSLVPRLAEWLQRQTYVTPQELASGARECLLRLDSGVFAWREWLPELSLEVVRDGHFGELPLLARGTFVDPFLGESVQFTVPETLTLGRGHRWFSFPLLVGQQDRRPIAWEARLDSPALPLDHDVRARLKLAYRYGLDNSYELIVEPESQESAPFLRLEAKWIKGGERFSATAAQVAPVFDTASWSSKDAERFLKVITRCLNRPNGDDFEKIVVAITRICWSQGRSIATAPPAIKEAFPVILEGLLLELGKITALDIKRVPRVLEVLTLLHEDAPEEIVDRVLSLDDEAADNRDLYK